MKKNLLSLLITILIGMISCDPSHEYYIEAKNKDILIEIYPSLESVYCPDLKEVCAFATSHRIRIGEEKEKPVYLIKNGEEFSVYGGVGNQASVNGFPFDFVKIIHGSDTLLLKSKEEIMKKFVRKKNTNKYYLSI